MLHVTKLHQKREDVGPKCKADFVVVLGDTAELLAFVNCCAEYLLNKRRVTIA